MYELCIAVNVWAGIIMSMIMGWGEIGGLVKGVKSTNK